MEGPGWLCSWDSGIWDYRGKQDDRTRLEGQAMEWEVDLRWMGWRCGGDVVM